jgi:hypothetical protein
MALPFAAAGFTVSAPGIREGPAYPAGDIDEVQMIYRMPIYTVRLALASDQVASCFGLAGLLDTIPRLDPELYSVDVLGPYGVPWETAGTAAVQKSGEWTLNLSDGREYGKYAWNTRLIRLGKIRRLGMMGGMLPGRIVGRRKVAFLESCHHAPSHSAPSPTEALRERRSGDNQDPR